MIVGGRRCLQLGRGALAYPPLPSPPSSPLPSVPPVPSPLPLELGPLIAARGSGERFSSPSGSGRQTVFGEFQTDNLASSSNDLRKLSRK